MDDTPWRAGADEATIFQTVKDAQIHGKLLKAGSYSIYILPGKTEWTIIFNKQTGQWGIKNDLSANFDPKDNV